ETAASVDAVRSFRLRTVFSRAPSDPRPSAMPALTRRGVRPAGEPKAEVERPAAASRAMAARRGDTPAACASAAIACRRVGRGSEAEDTGEGVVGEGVEASAEALRFGARARENGVDRRRWRSRRRTCVSVVEDGSDITLRVFADSSKAAGLPTTATQHYKSVTAIYRTCHILVTSHTIP